VAGTAGLSNDLGHVLDLRLGAAEGAEALLGQLAGALVLAVAEEFDDAALVGGETTHKITVNIQFSGFGSPLRLAECSN